jgi:hypothetical protein
VSKLLRRRSTYFSELPPSRWRQPRYGYRVIAGAVKNALEPDPAEQVVVALIRRLRGGGLSFRQIVDELHSRGIGARGGGPWYPATVARVLSYNNEPYRAEGAGISPGELHP